MNWTSVGDPDPQDPHVFGPPGSISQRCNSGSGSGTFPFLIKTILSEDNQIHNFISSSGSGTVISYGSGSDFLTSYGSGSGSTSQKVTVPPVPVPVPQHWDPVIRIRTIMSRIPNSVGNISFFLSAAQARREEGWPRGGLYPQLCGGDRGDGRHRRYWCHLELHLAGLRCFRRSWPVLTDTAQGSNLVFTLFFFGVSGVLNQFSQIQAKVRILIFYLFFGVFGVLNQFSQTQPKVRISSLLSFFGVSGFLIQFSQI